MILPLCLYGPGAFLMRTCRPVTEARIIYPDSQSMYEEKYKEEKERMAQVELKQPIVQEIRDTVENAQSVMLVKYLGLTVEQDTAMRKELREAGVQYKVFKNTMMNLAFKDTAYEELIQHLTGPNALCVTKDDPIAGARIISKYVKQHDCVDMIAGIIDGSYLDAEGLKGVANIPTREVLLGRLFGSMQSPIANFARVIKQIAEKDGEAAPAEEAAEAPAEAPAEEAAAPVEEAAEAPAEEAAEAPAEEAAEAPAE